MRAQARKNQHFTQGSCKNPEGKCLENSIAHSTALFSQECHECLGQLLIYKLKLTDCFVHPGTVVRTLHALPHLVHKITQ